MTHHLADALSDKGHDVFVLAPSDSIAGSHAAYQLIVDQNPAPQPVEGAVWRTEESPRLQNLLGQLQRDHNFDQFLAMHASAYGQAMTAMARTERPSVSTFFHGFELKSQLYIWKQLQAFRQKRAGHIPPLRDELLRVARTSDVVFTNSRFTANVLKRAGRPLSHVVGCGVPLKDIETSIEVAPAFDRAAKSNLRANLGLDGQKPLIGYVGRLVASKGLDTMLEALRDVQNAQCLIVGDGPERNRLEQLCQSMGLGDRVTFTGGVTEELKWQYLRALDVFCLLSQLSKNGEMEGFGIAALEASAAGTPCVVANSGGLPEAILDNETGCVVKTRSPKATAAVINELLASDELSARLVSQARRRIQNEQTWHHVAERMIRVWTS